MYYCNVNGLKLKQSSLKEIIENLAPKVIALCETKLPSDSVIKNMLPDYDINHSPTKVGQSGIVIAVKKQTFNSVLDVTKSSHKNIVVTRIGLDSIAIRVILGYAPQETDYADIREQFFTELEIEINESKICGDIPIILGDMNAKIVMEETEMKSVTPNGKLLLDLISDQNLNVLNFNKLCKGKWTHVIRTTGAASVLDYVMTANDILKHITEIIVDEECIFCPFSIQKVKGKVIPKYSDHNAIVTTFQIPHTRRKPINNDPSWKITDQGLEAFHEITSAQDFPTEVAGNTSKEKYDNYEGLLFETMDKCFRKRKSKKEHKATKQFLPLYQKVMAFSRGGKAQRKVARTYVQAMKNTNKK